MRLEKKEIKTMINYLIFGVAMTPFISITVAVIIEAINEYRGKYE